MKLIIAEKPSLQRAIEKGLATRGEKFKRQAGGEYSESSEYIATSVFGHLFELKDISDYSENEGKNMWQIETLPYFPNEYQYVIKKDCKTRFNTIKKLLKDKRIDEVIHCGDPDREGQVLIDIVLKEANNTKPVSRPLLKALTETAICEAFDTRRSNMEYKRWLDEGLARSYIDNDYGKNLSRYATVKASAKPALNVGRVIGAIIFEIFNRENSIKNFVPTKYFKVESDVNDIKLTAKKTFDENSQGSALEYANQLNLVGTLVKSVDKKEVTLNSPKLFSQTGLQAVLNKRFKYTPDETLALAQSLYEKGFTSYPRTNTEYIAEAEKSAVEKTVIALSNGELAFKDTKRVFDDSKIDGHSAIIPTGKKPSGLTEKEQNCYDVVLNRFKAVFCAEPCVVAKTEVTAVCGDLEEFKIVGEIEKTQGFRRFEPSTKGDKIIPDFQIHDSIPTKFDAVGTQTTPPPSYTVTTLGKWLENPFREENKNADDDYKNILAGLEIGTEATRAGILKKAVDKDYIRLEKSSYKIRPRGEYLVKVCTQLGIDMSKEKTAEMGKALKDIYNGTTTVEAVLGKVHQEIKDIFQKNGEAEQDANNRKVSVGTCPICGKPIYESAKAFGCSGWQDGCKFVIWKKIAGKKITPKLVDQLLTNGETDVMGGFKSKKGNAFSAKLVMKNNKVEFEFANK